MSVLAATDHFWPEIVAMLGLIVASGFFSCSETALFYLAPDDQRRLRGPRALTELLTDPDRLLTAILFWNLFINLTYFAVSVVLTYRIAGSNSKLSAWVVPVVSLCAIILLGEVLPKSLAVVRPRRLAVLVCWPLAGAVRLLDPLTPMLQRITQLLQRAFWPHVGREEYLELDDLEQAIENSKLTDEVIRQERQILHNILDLSEITVEEVMRPRGTCIMQPRPLHRGDLPGAMPPGGFVAITAEDRDDVEAVVMLDKLTGELPEKLDTVAQPVLYVPWSATLAAVLRRMQDRLCPAAVVVNEFGETLGIVTEDDILESIVVPDPSRAKRLLRREPVLEVAPGRFHVESITSLRYLARRLGIDFELEPGGQITLAGLLQDRLERIPQVGDECTWQSHRIRVIDDSRRGQFRVVVSQES